MQIITLYVSLVVSALLLLVLEAYTDIVFLLYLAAIPLEVLLAILILERYLKNLEHTKVNQQWVMFKSYIFRVSLKQLYINVIDTYSATGITVESCFDPDDKKLEEIDRKFSVENIDMSRITPVLSEYIRTEETFVFFLRWAFENGFEEIFNEIGMMLHFIQDLKNFQEHHGSLSPEVMEKHDPALVETAKQTCMASAHYFIDFIKDISRHHVQLYHLLKKDYCEKPLSISRQE